MSGVSTLIEIFRMTEISASVRANLIIGLGKVINNENGMNITEPIVYELVKILEPDNSILKDEHYLYYIKRIEGGTDE